MLLHAAILALAVATADTLPPARLDSVTLRPAPVAPAVEYSDAYYTRLRVHRIGSYTMLPLFAAEYLLGDRLLTGSGEDGWIKPTHVGVAMGIGGLFAVNTVTGLWNLWDARHDPNGRKLRYAHAALLVAADAGFALTPMFADDDGGNRTTHRNVAIGSMSVATLGTVIMWLRKD
jgi:hypothetical protein